MNNLKIAIIGATGLVGQTIIKVLDEEGLFFASDITLYVSSRSAGKEYLFKGRKFRLIELDEKALNKNFDIVFFSAGSAVSRLWVKRFAENGAFVIDNTSEFRKCEGVPLVVPEINFETVSKDSKIIANPNCTTIELAVVIDKLKKLSKIKKIVVSTYKSVSGAGRRAVYDLKNNAKNVFKYGINDNLIAKIGEIQENGYSDEENKIMFELTKILGENIDVSATAVRVPVEVCHGESVYVEFETAVNLIDVYSALECEHIKFLTEELCEVRDVKNKNQTFVFRIRQKTKTELEFFILADNLRRGAAYNAVLIMKKLIENNYV